ncbi:MAG: hypothetical protein LBT86_05455 [Deltaproteobacteria bacterium]|jgi:hypothetical protein|nr:hypothetical protein [Deltaproteobacteria bacterium]
MTKLLSANALAHENLAHEKYPASSSAQGSLYNNDMSPRILGSRTTTPNLFRVNQPDLKLPGAF